jgi:hypothetical protein
MACNENTNMMPTTGREYPPASAAGTGATAHALRLLLLVVLAATCSGCAGCYSFRQGTALPHLKTVYIQQVEDNSGSGRGTVRQDLMQRLVQRFRDDNTLRVVDANNADSRIDVTIVTINDRERLNISTAELETTRRVTIEVRATFTDNVKRRPVYSERLFRGEGQFNVNTGEAGINDAIRVAIDKLTTDILLESVAQW